MRKLNVFGTVLVICLISFMSQAQPNLKPSEEHLKAMQPLQFYAGEWEGEGWSQMGPQKSFFTIREKGTSKLNGSVFIFEGLGHDKTSHEVIHEAYGVVSYDKETVGLSMRAFRADGSKLDADFSVDEDSRIEWGFEVPQGKIKYIIENKEGQWHETGFIDMGGREFQFFEMTLTKI